MLTPAQLSRFSTLGRHHTKNKSQSDLPKWQVNAASWFASPTTQFKETIVFRSDRFYDIYEGFAIWQNVYSEAGVYPDTIVYFHLIQSMIMQCKLKVHCDYKIN